MLRAGIFAVLATAAALMASFSSPSARADSQTSVSGSVTEPNFAVKRFWVQSGGEQYLVRAGAATIRYHGHYANIYRLMGTPTVDVTGVLHGHTITADRVIITSGPKAWLQRSSYTNQAKPPFTDGELVPR